VTTSSSTCGTICSALLFEVPDEGSGVDVALLLLGAVTTTTTCAVVVSVTVELDEIIAKLEPDEGEEDSSTALEFDVIIKTIDRVILTTDKFPATTSELVWTEKFPASKPT